MQERSPKSPEATTEGAFRLQDLPTPIGNGSAWNCGGTQCLGACPAQAGKIPRVFGTYRYCLALLVVFGHFHPAYSGRLNWTGIYAVFCFFVLSGYLMTRVLHDSYGFSRHGLSRYLTNRALRIYPPYWVALAAGLVVLALFPDGARAVSKFARLPDDLGNLVRNIAIFGLHSREYPRVISPAWSLHVELVFYVLMGLGLARHRTTIFVWFLGSLTATVLLLFFSERFGSRYGTVIAGSLPFSLGAIVFLFSKRFPRLSLPGVLALALVFLFHTLGAGWIWKDVRLHGFYASTAIAGLVVLALSRFSPSSVPRVFARIDRFLGDLSYPIFLVHFPVAYALADWLYGGARVMGYDLGFLFRGLALVHVSGLAVYLIAIAPLERMRSKIRGFSWG